MFAFYLSFILEDEYYSGKREYKSSVALFLDFDKLEKC